MRILIVNSDSPENRGDRAILTGLVSAVHHLVPNAEITALSQYAERDEAWFGINFLPFSPLSLSPKRHLELLKFAKGVDLVLWGGGEILKDYTNRVGLIYWFVKISTLRLVNPKIIGAFQGIGSTSGALSKWIVKQLVEACAVFVVRDAESRSRLLELGVRSSVLTSYDPAVFGEASLDKLDCVGFGIRRWFHYELGGWLPFRYRFWNSKQRTQLKAKEATYKRNLAAVADWLIEHKQKEVRFFPMHMGSSEDDSGFIRDVVAQMRNSAKVTIFEKDSLSPEELLREIGRCQLFVATRLHSGILAALADVPVIGLHYADKGRVFFNQIGQPDKSVDISLIADEQNGIQVLLSLISSELREPGHSGVYRDAIVRMRGDILTKLREAFSAVSG